jgi:hypothetical protein
MIQHNRPQLLVIWVIWFSILIGVVTIQFVLGGGIPSGPDAPSKILNPVAIVAVAAILIASGMRWLLLPRANTPGKVLVLVIIGLALSESTEVFGLFLIPADQPSLKLTLWILSLASIVQFIPIYAKHPASRCIPHGLSPLNTPK